MQAHHQATLDTLIAIGTALAQDIRAAREADAITPTQAAEAFERVARATRRTILLAQRLGQSPTEPAAKDTPDNTQAARRELIRAVEDAITREPRAPTAESKDALETEFRERLDAPELAEDLATRPVAAILADILHDMDLGRLPFTGTPNWRRRTPAAIRRLHARAAGQAGQGAQPAQPSQPGQAAPPQDPGPSPTLPALHRLILGSTAPPA